jgi:hypothetical protein
MFHHHPCSMPGLFKPLISHQFITCQPTKTVKTTETEEIKTRDANQTGVLGQDAIYVLIKEVMDAHARVSVKYATSMAIVVITVQLTCPGQTTTNRTV